MSRFRRAAHGVASSYVLLVATAVYSLASLPVALHYLSKERVGLWTLLASYAGYFSLIDLGMSGSVARLLVDHKDNKAEGSYGRLIKTGWLVLSTQGAMIFGIGLWVAPLLAQLLRISVDSEPDFVRLVRWYCFGLGLTFAGRIPMHVLMAHQRIALVNYIQVAQTFLNLILQWLFFSIGQDIFSLAWAVVLSGACGQSAYLVLAWRLKLFAPTGAQGSVSWNEFKVMFAYGKDMFLVGLGTQLVWASQSSILTRRFGPAASTTWYAGTRAFSLVLQGIWRIYDSASPVLSEMMVRGEKSRLRERYRDIIILTASISGFAAVTFAACNSIFVTVWTHGQIAWPQLNDVLLGAWMIVMAVLHGNSCFVGLTKKIGLMRFIYFIEGVFFVIFAYIASGPFGVPGLIVCSVLGSTCFSGAYGAWRISRYFDLPFVDVSLAWLAPMGRLLLFFTPAAMAGCWALAWVHQPILRLAFSAFLFGSIGLSMLLRWGLPHSLQLELLHRAPERFKPTLKWLLQ